MFLGFSLAGSELVLYLLIFTSIYSIALIIERAMFYAAASKDLENFRNHVRAAAMAGKWDEALKLAKTRQNGGIGKLDLESGVVSALISQKSAATLGVSTLNEIANDEVVRAKIHWEKNLSVLATIGSNAPFVGLFGTVLGIIKAFHDLSQQTTSGAQTVSAGVSEALVATAIGILVAIPAVVAFNLFQRRVKSALANAEAMKSFLVGKLAG